MGAVRHCYQRAARVAVLAVLVSCAGSAGSAFGQRPAGERSAELAPFTVNAATAGTVRAVPVGPDPLDAYGVQPVTLPGGAWSDPVLPTWPVDGPIVLRGSSIAELCCPMAEATQVIPTQQFYFGNVLLLRSEETLLEIRADLEIPAGESVAVTFGIYKQRVEMPLNFEPLAVVQRLFTGNPDGSVQQVSSSTLAPGGVVLTPEVLDSGLVLPTFFAVAVGWSESFNVSYFRETGAGAFPRPFCIDGSSVQGFFGSSAAPPGACGVACPDLIIPSVFTGAAAVFELCFIAPPGACCLPDDTCSVQPSAAACEALGGEFSASGVECEQVSCPLPQGACCLQPQSCDFTNQFDCLLTREGSSWERNRNCSPFNPCGTPIGACCQVDGGCTDAVTQNVCETGDGTYQGDFTTCNDPGLACEQLGACCLPGGACELRRPDQCDPLQGQTFNGIGSHCQNPPLFVTDPCDATPGACCLYDGSCLENVTAFECENNATGTDGSFVAGASCTAACSPEPLGACCDDGDVQACSDTAFMDCLSFNCVDADTSGNCLSGLTAVPDGAECGTTPFGNPGECRGTPTNMIWYQGQPCAYGPCRDAGLVGACCVLGECTISNAFDCDQLGGEFTLTPSNGFQACALVNTGQEELDAFLACLAGPSTVVPGNCDVYDSDTDGDIDLVDFAEFQALFQGAGSGCAASTGDLGACCQADETCTLQNQATCDASGGFFAGAGVACNPLVCASATCCRLGDVCSNALRAECLDSAGTPGEPGTFCPENGGPNPCLPSGACCFANGTCSIQNEIPCINMGGVYQGDDLPCSEGLCPIRGACCTEIIPGFSVCEDNVAEDDCGGADQSFGGVNSVCGSDGTACAVGACCSLAGTCSETIKAGCLADPENVYIGDDTTCAVDPCTPRGACCLDDGGTNGFTCALLTEADCTASNGFYQGDGAACDDDACAPVACCIPGEPCRDLLPAVCVSSNGSSGAPGELCGQSADFCSNGACCVFNQTLNQTFCIDGTLNLFECRNQPGFRGFGGAGSDCSAPDACTNGACCALDGSCTDTIKAGCVSDPLNLFSDGAACLDDPCAARGACCLDGGTNGYVCAVLSAADCGTNGFFEGVGSFCSVPDGAPCVCDPDVTGDADADGDTDLDDFGAFSECFAMPDPDCLDGFDANSNGILTVFDWECISSFYVGPDVAP